MGWEAATVDRPYNGTLRLTCGLASAPTVNRKQKIHQAESQAMTEISVQKIQRRLIG